MTDAEMQRAIEQIEALIDSRGLSFVVDYVAEICLNKADHVLDNWLDRQAYEAWLEASNQLARIAQRKAITAVDPHY